MEDLGVVETGVSEEAEVVVTKVVGVMVQYVRWGSRQVERGVKLLYPLPHEYSS